MPTLARPSDAVEIAVLAVDLGLVLWAPPGTMEISVRFDCAAASSDRLLSHARQLCMSPILPD
eukprot:CAMPEP_0172059818 /NCGR_PEP_ID=MMETSP1043-20130122/7625_1 /TAXON_ID=464988 /ORGANISM="Hemiselmis andersenii, Strain CCMP441" /LENGTH=62 /DNA_ID=CAMNT_0012719525 /DNA_START=230 /DNA_END=418 /DNA_ORIENTATION=+